MKSFMGAFPYLRPQRDKLKRGCDILIATPGRLQDLSLIHI